MKNLIFILIIFFSSTELFAQELFSDDEFSEQMQNYFMHPSNQILIKMLRSYNGIDSIKKTASKSNGVMGFFSVAISKVSSKDTDTRIAILSECSKDEFLGQCMTMSKNISILIMMPQHDPNMNDLFWGAFFASGEIRYVQRIASELVNISRRDSIMLYMTAGTAKWSLCANAKRYPLVKKYLEEIEQSEKGEIGNQISLLLKMQPSEAKEEMKSTIHEFKK